MIAGEEVCGGRTGTVVVGVQHGKEGANGKYIGVLVKHVGG